jgi:hypothetical protein
MFDMIVKPAVVRNRIGERIRVGLNWRALVGTHIGY